MVIVGTFLVFSSLTVATSETNLALGKPSYQSGQWKSYTPNKAVDSHLQTDLGGAHGCTHTENSMSTPTPWWAVDLQGFYYVSSVTITNRGDCCSNRLTDFKVMTGHQFSSTTTGISEISNWKQCVHVPECLDYLLGNLGNSETRNIQCSEVHSGRFLSIYLDHNGVLTLCEVQVFGYPDYSLRVFQDKKDNTILTGDLLAGIMTKTKSQCAFYCFLDNTCTQFSYHGDVVGNNCLLGSSTSGQENQDGWVTIST